MKILIAYDGSDCSDVALDDLSKAGLPEVNEALVLSAVEIPSRIEKVVTLAADLGSYFPDDSQVRDFDEDLRKEAQAIATLAADRLNGRFPKWPIVTKALIDSPGPAIVRLADAWKPDLILMGSHGRSGFKRFMLGSVSEYVLNHTKCSVRIGRCRSAKHQSIRLLVGTDGSASSLAAVKGAAARPWPKDTEICVLDVVDSRSWLLASATAEPGSICMPAVEEELHRVASLTVQEAARELNKTGLSIITKVGDGFPGDTLVGEAEKWEANCIFIGARGLNALGRTCLGSISAAVVRRAPCSVEVVHG